MENRHDVVETFSVSRVAVLDGGISHEHLLGHVYGVRAASLDLESTVYENLVDGVVVSQWSIFKKANLSVTAGFLPMRILTVLNGSLLDESGKDFSAPLWEERQQASPEVSMLITVPARRANGEMTNLHFVLYRVQFSPISFGALAHKTGGIVSYTASARMSPVDETGSPVLDSNTGLPTTAIGRLFTGEIPADPQLDAGFAYYENPDLDFDGDTDNYDGGTA